MNGWGRVPVVVVEEVKHLRGYTGSASICAVNKLELAPIEGTCTRGGSEGVRE